jgi:hypothetical protein
VLLATEAAGIEPTPLPRNRPECLGVDIPPHPVLSRSVPSHSAGSCDRACWWRWPWRCLSGARYGAAMRSRCPGPGLGRRVGMDARATGAEMDQDALGFRIVGGEARLVARATARSRRVVLHMVAVVIVVESQVRSIDSHARLVLQVELLLIHPNVPGADFLQVLNARP